MQVPAFGKGHSYSAECRMERTLVECWVWGEQGGQSLTLRRLPPVIPMRGVPSPIILGKVAL
jgi:hypothetical protein